jgi:hypothetical protein
MLTKAIQTWNEYLINYTDRTFLTKDLSYYDNASNFFSAPGIIDFFGSKGGLVITDIQKFLNVHTDTAVSNLYTFSNSSQAYDLFNLNVFNNTNLFNVTGLEATLLFQTSKSLAQDIESISTAKADIGGMISVFPEYGNIIEMLEFHSIEDDGSLTEALSTPDVKLYYPEPFIASPSFVHEDLWFIHILHYQHWLWFMFISLIMFYFITFINVVR